MNDNLDTIIKEALSNRKAPSPELNRQIIVKAKERNCMKHNNIIKKSAMVAASVCLIAAGSVTAYAAYRYLSPAQVAEIVSDNGALMEAFEGDKAVLINETQSSNGYDITLLGMVSGKNLELYVPEDTASELNETHTYAAVAIAKTDGTKMEYRNFCISPLIHGVDFHVANNGTMDVFLTWFLQDGVIYELIECDNLEMFAKRGVQLGVTDSFGNETSAFQMDAQSGAYSKNSTFEGTNALFDLPLDIKKADEKAAEAYIKTLKSKIEKSASESEEETDLESNANRNKIQAFVDKITKENVDEYFTRDDNTVFTATPDEKGWIDFGSRYIEEEGYVMNGGSGYINYMIEDGLDFKVTGWVTSGVGEEPNVEFDLSDFQINVIERNDDGSYTTAAYRTKEDLSYILK